MNAETDSCVNGGNITVENLQDLLIYDDTFLDYFNVFLKLPVFPQPLEYQRLTDSFTILDEGGDSVVSGNSNPPFMASEAEHCKLLEWAQKYRLPLFLKTDLFRELKLSKLLIKPVETLCCSSRETYLHGYSKQTNCSSFTTRTPSKYSDLSSKSNSILKSSESTNSSSYKRHRIEEDSEEDFTDDIKDAIPYDIYLRPGSRAISLPIQIKMENEKPSQKIIRNQMKSENTSAKPIRNISNLSEEFINVKAPRQKSMKIDEWDEDNIFYRIQSAPLNFDAINFKLVNEEVEESLIDELENIEGRQKISLQRLKEMIIGTHEGMNEFGKFLMSTVGKSLCEFWLDCEQLKDLSYFRTEEENIDLRNNLMRNLKDKYKLSLTKAAKDQLNEAMKNSEKLHSIFLQAQYDTLRRLRSYWLPRYIIHQETLMRQYTITDLQFLRFPSFHSDTTSIQSGVFPKILLQKTLPYSTDKTKLEKMNWTEIMCMSNRSVIEPTKTDSTSRETSGNSNGIFRRSAFQNRLRFALGFDAAAGGPFKNYLNSQNQIQQIRHVEFFQEVLKFKSIFSRNSDRLLRISHAWSIVNKFLLPVESNFLEIPIEDSKEIILMIQKYKSSIKSTIFDEIVEISVKKVQQQWLIYLKEEVKRFMESSLTHFDNETPPNDLDEVEVIIEDEKIVVRRKLNIKGTEEKQSTWNKLSKKEKRNRREAALRLKEITENERQKVLKAVKKRIQEEIKRSQTVSYVKFKQTTKIEEAEVEPEEISENAIVSGEEMEIKVEEKIPEAKNVLRSKTMLSLFKKYATDHADKIGKDATNSVMLLNDLATYFSFGGIDKAVISTKDSKASFIYKNYFDKTAKRLVPLSGKIRNKLSNEQERPKTPTLKDVQNHVYNMLTEAFNEFWKFEITELGVKSEVLAKMNEKELLLIAENQLLEISKSTASKANSTAAHTKEDKKELILALQDASFKPLSLQILYFFNYLIEKGPGDKMNNLERDLFFYVEVLKLQEICRTTVDEEIAKKKIQCISNAFLESVHPPSVQINIPNDMAQQIIRRIQRQMTSKEINLGIFDEATYHCLKNLLPYWAGFQKNWKEPMENKFNPKNGRTITGPTPADQSLSLFYQICHHYLPYLLVNKYQRLLERRMKIYNDIPIPKADVVSLPMVPKSTNLTTLSYTMNDGAKWKSQEQAQDSNNNRQDGPGSESGKSVIIPYGKKFTRKASRLSVT